MPIPTEPIGSIPRPPGLIEAVAATGGDDPGLEALYEAAIRDTIARFEATGSPVISDGEQRKFQNFWTYPVKGAANADPDGFRIPFAAGHTRRMLRLTSGPFHYQRYADVHTCPGADLDSTHSAEIDYGELLPSLFELKVGSFYVALASEKDRRRVLEIIRDHLKGDQQVFIGVVAPIDPRVEAPEEIRDRVLEAAEYIPVAQLGTTDDCGFAPFSDDTSTSRDTAFAKIRARVLGTALASEKLRAG